MNRVMHALRQEQLSAEARKYIVRTDQPWNTGIAHDQLYPPSAHML
jgi:hypothetical protein